MARVCLVGGSGLVGSQMLQALVDNTSISTITALSRRELPQSDKLSVSKHSDTSRWPLLYPENTQVLFSALGTTARQAGSFAKQRKVDYDLNLALAVAAEKAGAKVYVLVSTFSASHDSIMAYNRMRAELDDVVSKLGFERVVILKPGLLLGTRKDSRPGEFVARSMATFLKSLSDGRLSDGWAQDAYIVAQAAVKAGLDALDGKQKEEVRIINQDEIVKISKQLRGC